MSSVWKSELLALSCSLEMHRQQGRRCEPLGKEHQGGWESHAPSATPVIGVPSKSHVPRDWSAKWVVNVISS